MRVAFRTDASSQIGTGHFMRCLTLAEALKKNGVDISFVSRHLPIYLSDMLISKGLKHIPLSAYYTRDLVDELAHASWLGVSQAQDAEATVEALSGKVFDWIVVDHYALDVRWESIVRPNVKKIMVIDDLADRHHNCDVLLDQNYYADMQTRYKGKVPAHCKLLLGPSYAMLRDEFRALREKVKVRNGDVKKVLVFFGGVDADNYTLRAIEALAEVNVTLQVDVVIGAMHPFKELIENTCAKYDYICHVQTSRMAELMMEADLSIGAGGSATWERCCLGLPAILIAFAKNQIDIVKNLKSIGACDYLSDSPSNLSFRTKINDLLIRKDLLSEISLKAYSLVDGLGAKRIGELMYEK